MQPKTPNEDSRVLLTIPPQGLDLSLQHIPESSFLSFEKAIELKLQVQALAEVRKIMQTSWFGQMAKGKKYNQRAREWRIDGKQGNCWVWLIPLYTKCYAKWDHL